MDKILSFDVSSVSTGWAFFRRKELLSFGVISNFTEDISLVEKLFVFENRIIELLEKYKPDVVLIEETYMKNVKTLKALMQFIGVLQVNCFRRFKIFPIFLYPITVRSHFKLKDKKDVFDFIKEKYGTMMRDYVFENPKTKGSKSYIKSRNLRIGNDVSDASLQGLYYIEKTKEVENNEK